MAATGCPPPTAHAGADPAPAEIPPDQATTQLERLLGSTVFAKAGRLGQFLRYVVQESLAGRGALLKEYTIALDVFGRPSSFDPRTDSVVRVAARALRSKLRDYYDGTGQDDPILIELPKGSYVPTLSWRTPPGTDAASTSRRPSRLTVRHVGLAGAVALLACSAAGLILFTVSRRLPPAPYVIAVLPFDNSSQAPEDAVFCEGLVDELTTRLAQTDGFQVMGRSSSRLLKSARDTAAEALKYKVDGFLDGRIDRAETVVRITARLTSTSSRYHVWSASYQKDVRDRFVVQDEIVASISKALRIKVNPPGSRPPRAPIDPESVRLYWTGRYVRRQAGPDAMRRAAALFDQSVRTDPRHAAAWSALADVNALMGYHQVTGRSPAELAAAARAAADKALALDAASAEAFAARGLVELYLDRDWDRGALTLRQALEADPTLYKARVRFAQALLVQGKFDEAVLELKKGVELDPMSIGVNNDLAACLYAAHRYEEAIKISRQNLAADPGFSPAHALLAVSYSGQNRWSESIPEYLRAIAMSERFSYLLGGLGHDYARSGNRAKALELLKELTESPDQSSVSYVHVAFILSGLGEQDRAIDALEKAVARNDADVMYLGVHPLLDRLRGHPRFARLLESLGLRNVRR